MTKRPRTRRGATINRGAGSNLEGAVLDAERRRLRSRAPRIARRRRAAIGRGHQDARPSGCGKQRRRNRERRRMVGRRRRRMAVFVATVLVERIGRMARRCPRSVRGDRGRDLLRTHIRRHRELLKQQSDQRNERDAAAAVATAKRHGQCGGQKADNTWSPGPRREHHRSATGSVRRFVQFTLARQTPAAARSSTGERSPWLGSRRVAHASRR